MHLQLKDMQKLNKVLRIVLLVIALTIVCASCKKNKNIINIEGKVFDPNTNEYVAGADVVISVSKLSSSGIYSSGYENLTTLTTDASGSFKYEFQEEKIVGYRFTISKDHYFGFEKEVNTSEIVAGTTFSPTYNIYPECFIRMEVHNVAAQDSNDKIVYGFTSGYVSCFECCDNNFYHGYGIDYADTIICKTHGNQNVVLTYNVTRGGTTLLHTMTHYCNAFDTTSFNVFY